MKIRDLYGPKKKIFSFEFFPPKNQEGEEKLFESLEVLKPLCPAFVSVTYGAMGNTRTNTLRIVDHIQNRIGIETAGHFACLGHTRPEIETVLGDYLAAGVKNIVALRGDLPKDAPPAPAPAAEFGHASDLVAFIRDHPEFSQKFSMAVAGYPEGHLECRDKAKDLEYLKVKVDAGADAVITQLFFDNETYFDFVRRARRAGIRVPIVPGIMPVTHGPQIERFAQMCGASIPAELRRAIEHFGEDQTSVENFGIEFATRQCEELLKNEVPGLHFFTLNKSRATLQIYKNLHLSREFERE